MFNDDYEMEEETSTQENNNDSGSKLKLILIIAGIFIVFIVILLVINSATKSKTTPTPTPSAPVLIDPEEDEYESGEDEEEEEQPEEQRVGNSSYGYVTIPGDWQEYQDVASNTSLQYTDGSYIITLKAVDSKDSDALSYAKAIKQKFINDGVDTTGATVSLGKYKAYQVYGYYTSVQKWHVCWIFEAEDGKTHFISVEGPEKTSAFKIPETFSIVR